MDLKAQNNQTRSQAPAAAPVAAPAAPRASVVEKERKNPMMKIVVGVAILLVLIAAAVGAKMLYAPAAATVAVDHSKFQAVFLSNGQVYFGKIDTLGSDYTKLTNIYYLQVQQDVQPAKEGESTSGVSLTKLGSELHGPEDEMYISKDQILFWENLKKDSRVVKTITEFEAKK